MLYLVMTKDGESWVEVSQFTTLEEAQAAAPEGAQIEAWNGCTTIVQAGS